MILKHLCLCATLFAVVSCSSAPPPPDYWPLDGIWLLKIFKCKKGELSEQGKMANKKLARGEYRGMIRYEKSSERFMVNMYNDPYNHSDRCEGQIDSEIRYPKKNVLEVLRSTSKFEAHGRFQQRDCLGDSFTASYKRVHHFEFKGSRLILKLSDSQPFPQLSFDFCSSGQPIVELERAL